MLSWGVHCKSLNSGWYQLKCCALWIFYCLSMLGQFIFFTSFESSFLICYWIKYVISKYTVIHYHHETSTKKYLQGHSSTCPAYSRHTCTFQTRDFNQSLCTSAWNSNLLVVQLLRAHSVGLWFRWLLMDFDGKKHRTFNESLPPEWLLHRTL